MRQRDRVRRAGILCCRCIRNIAFYRSGHSARSPFAQHQFWINANGNFLDVATLEWCKLFSDKRGKHHYTKVVEDPGTFMQDTLKTLNLRESIFEAYLQSMQMYRDKFIAHLDDLKTMDIPDLTIAKQTTELLYKKLTLQESKFETFRDAPHSITMFYDYHLEQGKTAYKSLT